MIRIIALALLILIPINAYSQPVPFPCDEEFYFVFGEEGQLFSYNVLSDTVTIAPSNAGESLNALGYRESNNLIYGIFSNGGRLAQVSADGSVVDLGVVPGLDPISYPAGDFGPDDRLYIYRGDGPDPNRLFVIDVDSVEIVETIDIMGPMFVVADIAFNPTDGRFYGVTNDYQGIAETVLFAIDIDTRTTEVIGPVNTNAGNAAMFSTLNGDLFSGSTRNVGNVARYDALTGQGEVVGNVAMEEQEGGVDGTFCSANPGPFARNVPTLSEWGLIAMVALLGIVGFIAIRRRSAQASA